jgi:hypothetical protein
VQRRHWIRIVGPLLLFAAVGTVGVILLLNSAFQRVTHSEFVALAEADADFIRDTIEAKYEAAPAGTVAKTTADFMREAQVAQTEFQAGHLGQFLGVEVRFEPVTMLDARHEAVTIPINLAAKVTLIRERPRLWKVLLQPISIGALTAFWALWFALAWAVILPSLNAQRFGLLGSIANYWNKPSPSTRA